MIAMKVCISAHTHMYVCVCNEIQVLYLICCQVYINIDLNDENSIYNTM